MLHLLKMEHLKLLLLLLLVIIELHEVGHDVYGNREYYGAVVLSRYTVQGLKIPQLEY